MNDRQWLRDGLRDAVPTPPASPDRAASARDIHRRHRHRTRVVAVVSAAVVIACLAVAPRLVSGGDPVEPGPSEPHRSNGAAAAFPCPPPMSRAKGSGGIPPGAVAVRLCRGPGIAMSGTFLDSREPLVTGVDDLVEIIQSQPRAPGAESCTQEEGAGYLLAFRYADGTVFPVTGKLYGCHYLHVGSLVYHDAERPYREFLRLIAAQRADSAP